MQMQKTNLGRSVDTIISINNVPLGGQQAALLTQQAQAINITNKITGEWAENLTGTKSWAVTCSGLYIINDDAFLLLEQAFMSNKPVEVLIKLSNQELQGKALIVDFPLNAIFNKEFKYNIKLLGTGPLM